MITIKAEHILQNKLSNNIVHRYTVISFCADANINRGVFYHYYRNISDLFISVLSLQIRRALRSVSNETIEKLFYQILIKIRDNKLFYLNMLMITKEPREFYSTLRKEIAHAIELYMRPRGSFSVRQVEVISNGIYAIIFNWILNDCKPDIRDVYQSINLLLEHLESNTKTLKK
ncbi:hypothetical protein DS833_01020 [Lactobacillus bombicola]|uniref:HTH tetR-type domain-containing protein n=2 Tax=Lactobacillus bombicola TaxID=1505723 RepID=A0A396SQM1_9LACO|nr:hypothetical protein DS834_04940 [Lactobacillus bombicola]RHW52493.1 hypothetical protein DS833_01020 [Lactobacillus bombicola]RHW53947.1 hypothetical protein DS835_05415 [Lactobacillus bombicola]